LRKACISDQGKKPLVEALNLQAQAWKWTRKNEGQHCSHPPKSGKTDSRAGRLLVIVHRERMKHGPGQLQLDTGRRSIPLDKTNSSLQSHGPLRATVLYRLEDDLQLFFALSGLALFLLSGIYYYRTVSGISRSSLSSERTEVESQWANPSHPIPFARSSRPCPDAETTRLDTTRSSGQQLASKHHDGRTLARPPPSRR
jgi:hypothetical protein